MRRGVSELIGGVVSANAETFADKTAFVDNSGRVLTFAALRQRAQQLGAALQALGVQRGDRIAVLLRNRTEYVEVYCAAAYGFVVVPLNSRLPANDLALIVARARPRVVVSEPAFAPTLEHAMAALSEPPIRFLIDGLREGWRSYEEAISGASLDDVPSEEAEPSAPAALLFTSGTTGRPKGVALTHRGLVGNSRLSAEVTLSLTPQDVTLCCMPMFHVGGMWYHLFASYLAGSTTYISDDAKPSTVLAMLSKYGITHTHLVPTMLHDLLELPSITDSDLTKLRLILYAASSISPSLLERALDRLQHCAFVQGYGSTEAGQITCLSDDDHRLAMSGPERRHLLLSCGRPIKGVSVRIDAMAGDDTGEILVRSPFTMAGYWEDESATRQVMESGWLRTGDVGRMDDQGYCYVLDRKSDMIVTGGENVFPKEVEDAILHFSPVMEVAVFGLPDRRWVQRVVAAIVSRDGARIDVHELRRFLTTRLADYKCPKQVILVESLPKSPAGKVLRRVLRTQYEHLGT